MTNVVINPDKTISINGIKKFPVGMYYISGDRLEPTLTSLSKNTDFDFSAGGGDDVAYRSAFENMGQKYTLDYIPSDPAVTGSQAFFAVMQADEPTAANLSAVQSFYNTAKAYGLPVILNNWTDMILWYMYCDIITWDIYTIKSSLYWVRKDSIYAYEHYTDQAFLQGHNLNSITKPVWAVIQANGLPFDVFYVPTEAEARCNTYTAITMDVKGIVFWGYKIWTGTVSNNEGLVSNSTEHSIFVNIAKELNSLNDVLVSPTIEYSWTYYIPTSPKVQFSSTLSFYFAFYNQTMSNFNYILKQVGTTYYLFVVNKDSRPISNVNITIAGATGTATTIGLQPTGSGRAGRSITVNGGTIIDSFDSYAVHIYKIGATCSVPVSSFKLQVM